MGVPAVALIPNAFPLATAAFGIHGRVTVLAGVLGTIKRKRLQQACGTSHGVYPRLRLQIGPFACDIRFLSHSKYM